MSWYNCMFVYNPKQRHYTHPKNTVGINIYMNIERAGKVNVQKAVAGESEKGTNGFS